jgi:hopene-associated glycosyltransferase HpnB
VVVLGILIGLVSVMIWLGIWLHPACPWDFQPVGDDEPMPSPPSEWPAVCILVPARNERDSLPHTLPALLQQDYPGPFMVVVVDDRSQDGTAEIARALAHEAGAVEHLLVVNGKDLPIGWVGKVWALEQGATVASATQSPKYLLLTDADIRHAPSSLRRLVSESEHRQLALNSRMARLHCVSQAEQLLVPPFVFFFNLLYPMRQVNDSRSRVAAAAGGCVLLATEALTRAGGFACIRDRIIDDVSLARQIKAQGVPLQLALSCTEVESLRVYDSIAALWIMVRRTAFTELRYSWVRLTGAVLGLLLMFLVPPLWLMVGLVWGVMAASGGIAAALLTAAVFVLTGLSAWMLMARVYQPAVRFFGLFARWVWTLPLAGLLYGAMTVDSALRYATGMRMGWRDR